MWSVLVNELDILVLDKGYKYLMRKVLRADVFGGCVCEEGRMGFLEGIVRLGYYVKCFL